MSLGHNKLEIPVNILQQVSYVMVHSCNPCPQEGGGKKIQRFKTSLSYSYGSASEASLGYPVSENQNEDKIFKYK